jgi:macrodomain Ter protein organizer (MatP/YcbG family)
MPKGKPHKKGQKRDPEAEARAAAFREVNNRFEFNEYSISDYAKYIRSSWIKEHLNSHMAQTLSKRAFKAVQKKSFGIARRVRFKGNNQFGSIECKNNDTGLIFRDNMLAVAGLKLPVIIDANNEYQKYGLNHRVKYCRLLRKNLNGRIRYYVQLILEGTPYQNPKHPIGQEEVGQDLGPSTITYVGDTRAELKQFCEEIVPDWKKTRRLQRKMDRSRRTTNPQNYNPDGTIPKRKKGDPKRVWTKSNQYKKLQRKYAETNRKIAEHRKSLHGKMANDILSLGKDIKTEKISYRAWQKMFGRSVTVRAPSMMASLIQRKAENAHGSFLEIPTQTTALSQTCHMSGNKVKKPLKDRWHVFPDGTRVQRDLYSAFLAKCCAKDQEGNVSLDIAKAERLWPGAELLLNSAMSRVEQAAESKVNGRGNVPASFGLARNWSLRTRTSQSLAEVADVVSGTSGESCEKVSATEGISRL